jgi:hypothetical protein
MTSWAAASYPIYYNAKYTNVIVTKTKWIVQEMADGSPIPGTRDFGDVLPMVSYEMKNMASLPFEVASAIFHPRQIILAGRLKADYPGPKIREAILRGYEETIDNYTAYLKEDHGHAAQDMSPMQRQEKLADFQHRIVPEVRKRLGWKKTISKTARRVVLRFFLAQILPQRSRTKVAINTTGFNLPTLWYENEAGDKWFPNFDGPGYPDEGRPADFKYQHSRFPRTLVHNCLRLISQEDVDACHHKETLIDHGLIEGLEGRICRSCGGSQTTKVGEPWPAKWHGGGSKEAFRAESTYPVDLVLSMVRPTAEEGQRARARGFLLPEITTFERAVLLAATACERCLNVLCWQHGLDDGYEEGSPEWEEANTRCALCE